MIAAALRKKEEKDGEKELEEIAALAGYFNNVGTAGREGFH